ncbi:MAG: methylmalonyl Co-A mutase-associated GTPase MeaB [Thermoplasmata archaeon]|nr:MAG: methylmalonyl Co-A mutase-associated GTPase MeaB [Thermoplasmata archaeon]
MINTLTSKALQGDQRSIAKLITIVENDTSDATDAMKQIHPHTGNAHVIGITGVMGCGKSTLIYELTKKYRKQGKTVGIIAIDPTSPFSGGALLGDRIRMMELAMDEGVFIRSMGTRGMLGGLTSSVYDVVEIMDASGKDIVLVETVGVGQAEVDIIKISDTTIVVVVPGLGDSIQTLKAGIMEIADIYVVNKADRQGVEQTVAEVQSLVEIECSNKERKTPIIETIAKESKHIDTLVETIDEHKQFLKETKKLEQQRRNRYESELVEIIRKKLMSYVFNEEKFKETIEDLLQKIRSKEIDPHTASELILKKIMKT